MSSIIEKYFSEHPKPGDYAEKNEFSRPADLDKIKKVEKNLAIKFPQDYIEFLCITNGYTGKVGESYSVFIKIEMIEEYTKSYGGDFFPWIVFIGTDGGNEMYVIDRRNENLKFGILPYIGDENDFISLGDTFEEFVGHLYSNDYWNTKNGG
jgi:hypothetical protein